MSTTAPTIPTSTTSSAPTSTTSANDGYNTNNGQGSTPLSVFTFVIAIALFVIVVAFVLLRICLRNRRLRRMGIIPEGPLDRFLTGGPVAGYREVEDTVIPPKLWGARIRPPPTNNSSATAASGVPNEKSGWENLVPLSASLPTNLYHETGALTVVGADGKDKTEIEAAKNRDPNERIQSSVNVSVLIAMPSAPKDDGSDELPELMLGTAAVPIFSRVSNVAHAANSTAQTPAAQTAIPGGGYFALTPPSGSATQPTVATQHPTRAQLLSLYKAAKDAKDRSQAQKEAEAQAEAAAAAEEQAVAVTEEAEAVPQRRSSSLPSQREQEQEQPATAPEQPTTETTEIPLQSMPVTART